MKLLWLTGFLVKVWAFILPLLKSEVGKFLADPRVQNLAIAAVERAAQIDLNNDGKYDHAVADLASGLKEIGVEYYKGWIGMAVEAAWRAAKDK